MSLRSGGLTLDQVSMGDSHWRSFATHGKNSAGEVDNCLLWETPCTCTGQGWEESFPAEAGVAETMWDELTASPEPVLPVMATAE